MWHKDFEQEFVMRQIHEEEDLEVWINMVAHSNIVTCVDQFKDMNTALRFQLVETNNGGNMYSKIQSLIDGKYQGVEKLNLNEWVPVEYIEMVYDCTIQLVTAMDFAHNHKLIHGQLDLSKVKISKGPLAQKDCAEGYETPESMIPYYNLEFEITDFAPMHTMTLPLEPEATYWPFSKQKDPKKLTENERMEVLMLKDVYAIGICILEMMIGRFDRLKFNINIDNIPSEWGNLPESSTLIKVLVECIQLDSISKRQGKLAEIRKLLIQDYKKHFNKNYRMEVPFIGKRADNLNKRACVEFFNDKSAEA